MSEQTIIKQANKSPKLRRATTEASIVSALETVLKSGGVRALGVNSVVKQAGIGKGLIYKYFGGLSGLVRVWAEKKALWSRSQEKAHISPFSNALPEERIKEVVLAHAETLKSTPLACEILAEELLTPASLTPALDEVRSPLAIAEKKLINDDPSLREKRNKDVMMIAYAAATYLAMRARSAPDFMGVDLSDEDDWEAAMAALESIVENAAKPALNKSAAEHSPMHINA